MPSKAATGQQPDNIYLRGKTWYGRIEIGGDELRRSLRTGDEQEARRIVAEWIEEEKIKRGLAAPKLTWKEAAGRYLLEVAPGALKPNVLVRYTSSLRQVAPWLEDLPLDKITRKKIAEVVSGRKLAGATNATVNRDLTAISRVLSACVAWGWRDDNPARDYDRSLTRERRDPIVLPPDDHIEAMIDACPPNLARLLWVLRWTGMREKEGALLEWHQVDLQGRRELLLTKTKTDRPRVIPLTDLLTRKAAEILERTPKFLKSGFVFWHDQGEPYQSAPSQFCALRRRINEARKKKGLSLITFRIHDLRHRFAVDYLRAGGNIYRLQQLLGHSSIKTTELYLSYLTPDEQLRSQHGEVIASLPAHRSAQ